MTTRLPTQLPAHVDNAPSRLKAARYPQANNCVDNRFHASYTKITTRPAHRVLHRIVVNRDIGCQRRLNIEPPCRSSIEPGRVAGFCASNCG